MDIPVSLENQEIISMKNLLKLETCQSKYNSELNTCIELLSIDYVLANDGIKINTSNLLEKGEKRPVDYEERLMMTSTSEWIGHLLEKGKDFTHFQISNSEMIFFLQTCKDKDITVSQLIEDEENHTQLLSIVEAYFNEYKTCFEQLNEGNNDVEQGCFVKIGNVSLKYSEYSVKIGPYYATKQSFLDLLIAACTCPSYHSPIYPTKDRIQLSLDFFFRPFHKCYLKKFGNLEFRIFVKNGFLTAISQQFISKQDILENIVYDFVLINESYEENEGDENIADGFNTEKYKIQYYEKITKMYLKQFFHNKDLQLFVNQKLNEISNLISENFTTKIKPNLPENWLNFTYDFSILRIDAFKPITLNNLELYFIEPNGFGARYSAGSALFGWALDENSFFENSNIINVRISYDNHISIY